MEWTRPLGALVAVAIAVWTVGALYTLLRGLVVETNPAALVTLAVVAVAVLVAAAVGRRSDRWTENPDTYW